MPDNDDVMGQVMGARMAFRSRYAAFGVNDSANLDEGAVWPVAFALTGADRR